MKKDKMDVAEEIVKMQQQLISLERKIDTLISKPANRPFENRPFESKPRQDRDHRERTMYKQDRDRMERSMYKAVCADCNKECEVPFRPSQDRPVYCKDCFSSRKADSPFKPNYDNRPQERDTAPQHPFAKYHRGGKNQRPTGKKKPVFKRRKK